jgi:hypothetical protein
MSKCLWFPFVALGLLMSGCQLKSSDAQAPNADVSFSPGAPQPLDLTIVTSPLANGLRIEGETNLPDGTELMLSVQRGPVVGGDKVAVVDGRFSADIFPKEGKPIPTGPYEVEVSTPLGDLQPGPVKAMLGSNYEALTGPLLVKSMFGGRIIEYVTKVEFGGPANPVADKAARQRAYREYEARTREDCNSNPELVERLTGKPMSPSERANSIKRCLHEAAKGREELIAEGLIEP